MIDLISISISGGISRLVISGVGTLGSNDSTYANSYNKFSIFGDFSYVRLLILKSLPLIVALV